MERIFDLTDLGRRADRHVRDIGGLAFGLSSVCLAVGLIFLAFPPGGEWAGVPVSVWLAAPDLLAGTLTIVLLALALRPSYTSLRVDEVGIHLGDARGGERTALWDDPSFHWAITDWRRARGTRVDLGLRLWSGSRFGRGATLSPEAYDAVLTVARFKRLRIDLSTDRGLVTRRIDLWPAR